MVDIGGKKSDLKLVVSPKANRLRIEPQPLVSEAEMFRLC